MVSDKTNACVLLLESHPDLAHQMSLDLQEAGYVAQVVKTPAQALQHVEAAVPSLIVVDRGMEEDASLPLCRQLRDRGIRAPIMVFMASDSIEDRIACLDAGADDYVLKPYRTDVFLGIVRLYLQPSRERHEQLRFGGLTLDLVNRVADRNGRMIDLTMKEFELLRYLMEHPREVLQREQILANVWGYDFIGESNVIEVYIRYLRLKIDGDNEKRLIQTVRGVGYVLRET